MFFQAFGVVLVLGVSGVANALLADPLATSQSDETRYIFSFGDSYTSNNHSFNISQAPGPSRSCPVGPAEGCVGPSTSNDGSQGNWILDVTTEFNRSCTVLFNYAISGAVVDGEIIGPGWVDTIKQTQLSMFNDTVAHVPNIWANWTQSNTLASFFIGINDNGYTYNRPNHTETVINIMAQYFDIVQELYDLGIRHFMFLNVPPIWLTPLFIGQGNVSQTLLQESVDIYNTELHTMIDAFKSTYPDGLNVYEFNISALFTELLDNPVGFGFSSPIDTYCNRSTCIWYDAIHATSWVHQIIAAEIAEYLSMRGFW